MTKDQDELRAALRALKDSPTINLLDYGSDPVIRKRVGRMIVEATERSANEHKSTKPKR